jgi:hypothetical protein
VSVANSCNQLSVVALSSSSKSTELLPAVEKAAGRGPADFDEVAKLVLSAKRLCESWARLSVR